MNNTKDGIPRLLQLAGRKKYLLLLSSLLAVLNALMSLVPYILIFYIIKQLLTGSLNIHQSTPYISYAIIAGIASYFLLYLSGIASHIAAFNILYELRKELAVKIGKLPIGVLDSYSSGGLNKIVSDDVERIENFIAHQIPDFVKGLALPIITISYLFTINWLLAIVSFVPLLVLAIWMPLVFRSKLTKEMMQKYHTSQEVMSSGIVEFVRAMPVMKIFGQTASGYHQYSDAVNDYFESSMDWMKRSAKPFAFFMSFISNATLPILALGLWMYIDFGLEASTLVLFLILGVGYLKPLFALSNMGMQITLINQGVKRMDAILLNAEQTESQHPKAPKDFTIEFDNVSFSYEDKQEVLKHVSVTIPQGQITAFVGASGAGKSTAAQLITRFWDVKNGSISIGGINVNEIPVTSLMEQVAFVLQDSFMFEESIFENIRMGMNKNKDEIVRAAKAARCHNFISKLPKGYDTMFGAYGVHLSGGEKQRIQLARAILKNAPILILDEATAFSDPENEFQIQQAFSSLIKDKTVIVIAHRLSTIVDADQIVVFEDGQVHHTGTHNELIETSSTYEHLWLSHVTAQNFAFNH